MSSKTTTTTTILSLLITLSILRYRSSKVMNIQLARTNIIQSTLNLIQANNNNNIPQALDIILKTLQTYKINEIVIAFNGGKDCLVVLYLVLTAYSLLNLPQHQEMIKIVYFEKDDEFPEMIEFMMKTISKLNLNLEILKDGYKSGLRLLESRGVKVVIMGQRRTDPYCPDQPFAKTTSGWPEMLRVNPIIDFDYEMVWKFIRGGNFDYCCLYDKGYTSLGSRSETTPHPQLVLSKQSAFELKNGDVNERIGRTTTTTTTTTTTNENA
jgi:FAD synthetase